MPTRSSEFLRYIDQGNFSIWKEDNDDNSSSIQEGEVLIAHANRYGWLFLAHKETFHILDILSLEDHFEADSEVELPSTSIITTMTLSCPIRQIVINEDNHFVVIATTSKVILFDIGAFSKEVTITANHADLEVTVNSLAENFSCQWISSNKLVILEDSKIYFIDTVLKEMLVKTVEERPVCFCSGSGLQPSTLLLAMGTSLILRDCSSWEIIKTYQLDQHISTPFGSNIQDGIIAVGYKQLDKGGKPSLAITQFDSKSSLSNFIDLKSEVCMIDHDDAYKRHRFYSSYIKEWHLLLVSSNLSSTCAAVSLQLNTLGLLEGAFVEEPDDEQILSIVDQGNDHSI
eukprot:scaffold14361_cov193-Ochromonas_danica.AAC.2